MIAYIIIALMLVGMFVQHQRISNLHKQIVAIGGLVSRVTEDQRDALNLLTNSLSRINDLELKAQKAEATLKQMVKKKTVNQQLVQEGIMAAMPIITQHATAATMRKLSRPSIEPEPDLAERLHEALMKWNVRSEAEA